MSSPERELKILLTKDQYETLLNTYPFEKTIVQKNVYYDTDKETLKNEKKAFRTRTIGSENLVTLKLPIDEITKEEFEFPVSSSKLNEIRKEELTEVLPYLPDLKDLHPIAEIETTRSLLETDYGTFCLDLNKFGSITDYELEYEYKKDHDGIKALNEFLTPTGLHYEKNCTNKIARAMAYKENL